MNTWNSHFIDIFIWIMSAKHGTRPPNLVQDPCNKISSDPRENTFKETVSIAKQFRRKLVGAGPFMLNVNCSEIGHSSVKGEWLEVNWLH